MQKCLVTGASGFVGFALCKELAKRGYQVVAGYRVEPEKYLSKDSFIVGDIDDSTHWDKALKGVDVIFHTAARVHQMNKESKTILSEYRRINVLGTERLARAAACYGIKRLVYLSSLKVNGEETFPPSRFVESNPAKPQDPYAISKHEAEQVLYRVANETGLEVVVIRPPLIYGPNVKGNLKALLNVLSKNIPMPFASVNNKRDLLGLGNLLDAMILCGNHPKAKNQTYLISDGHSKSTSELIKIISNALGVKCYQFHFPLSIIKFIGWLFRKSDSVSRLTGSLEVDTSKISSELNWTPPMSFEDGVRIMVGREDT